MDDPRASKIRDGAEDAAVLPVAICAPYLPNGGLAIAAMCFTRSGHALWVANLQTLPTDMFPPEIGTLPASRDRAAPSAERSRNSARDTS